MAKAWTAAEKDQALNLKAAGVSHSRIAAELGRPTGSVAGQLSRLAYANRAGIAGDAKAQSKPRKFRTPEEADKRRRAILAHFKTSVIVSGKDRVRFAKKYGVQPWQVMKDVYDLRNAGCLRATGSVGRFIAYEWVKPYERPKPVVAEKPETTKRNCMCCGAEFDSQGPHNRRCSPCRKQDDGVTSYAVRL